MQPDEFIYAVAARSKIPAAQYLQALHLPDRAVAGSLEVYDYSDIRALPVQVADNKLCVTSPGGSDTMGKITEFSRNSLIHINLRSTSK